MNRYTIIVEDKSVSVDGVGYSDVSIDLPTTIHAVQWYGTYGEIEFSPIFNPETTTITKASNEIFTNPDRFKSALDAWIVADLQAKEALEAAQKPPLEG